jgi:MoaA/NifB/PqqE/SkfB family radical SAM enzyme
MRLANWVSSVLRNRRGAVAKPSWCTYLVTYRCNARCQMCDSWQMEPGEELTVPQIHDVFGKIGRLDVVRISGGEPFLRKDLLDVAEAVMERSRPKVLHITTNGSFHKRAIEFVKQFSKPKRLRFMVSFDGLADEHDANRGPGVPFRRAVETVQSLAELRRTHGIEVSANHTVISPQSMEDNAGLRETLGALDVEVHSVLAYAESSMYGMTLHGKAADHLIVPVGYPLHPKLAGVDAIGFVERELADVGNYRSWLLRMGKRYYLRGLLARLRGEGDPRPKPRCVELRSHIRLLPDGRVPICQFNTETVGSLRDESFDAVWHNGTSADARKWVDGCPGCWAECEVMPNAIYTGDILRGGN